MAAVQIDFPFAGTRKARAVFDAEPISSDGSALLLRQVDRRIGLLDSLAAALPDRRDPRYVEHTLIELLRQRVYGIALGYEDCNDATTMRRDPVLKTCCGRDPFSDDNLASQPTLSRLENEAGHKSCYLLARVILESYFVRHPKRPKQLILDLDTTADSTHGQQEFSAFHAFYDEHIYLPLLIYDQDGDLTHYRILLAVDDVRARTFYEIEAEREGWPVPHLERQVQPRGPRTRARAQLVRHRRHASPRHAGPAAARGRARVPAPRRRRERRPGPDLVAYRGEALAEIEATSA